MSEQTTITAANGVPFIVKVLFPGDKYGRNDGLITKSHKVEFYDARYEPPRGQFVCRYYLRTLCKGNRPYGLDLNAGEPDWTVDKQTMGLVFDWLGEVALDRWIKQPDTTYQPEEVSA